MKKIFFTTALLFSLAIAHGQTVFEKAKQEAKQTHKLVLLNFSGSDWCVPCIKMHQSFFENADFKNVADKLLVLVNADFPRNKKNKVDNNTKKQNEVLADKYNPQGIFPYTLLLDENGVPLKKWSGMPAEPVADWIKEIIAVYNKQYRNE
jgi:thiol-disulfide isomerase/thioredoxin